MTTEPRSVLVVASWYPSVDGLAAGRFVADQVSALRDAGRFRPLVASFDPLATWGSRGLRRRERTAIHALCVAGVGGRTMAVFRAGSAVSGAPGPVARLPVAAPDASSSPADAIAHRLDALEAAAPAIAAIAGDLAIVHAHTGLPDGVAAARFARRRGLPLVLTEHSSTLPAIAADPARRALYGEALASASAIIAVSEALAADIRAIDPSVGSRLQTIGNVVAVADFAAPPVESRRADELLFVGFRKAGKGIDLLLDAFARARARRPALRLRLVGAPGAGEDERAWQARAAGLGIADAVSLEPETDRAGVAAAMARASIFVHPSPRETFGVVAAEALASGLPVVAVDSGGVPEILGPEPTAYGRVVRRGDPAALAGAILDVLDRRGEFPAEALRRWAVDRFGPDAVARALAEVYASVLAAAPETGNRRDPGWPAGSTASAPGAAHPPAPPSPAARPDVGPPAADRGRLVIIGSDRRRAARILRAIPVIERARVALVTSAGPASELPPDLGQLIVVDGLAARLAARHAVGDVAGPDQPARRRSLRRRPLVVLRELAWRSPWRERQLVRRTVAAAGRAADGAPGAEVVGLDGFDALIAHELVQAGLARPAAGAGRWLADDRGAPSDRGGGTA